MSDAGLREDGVANRTEWKKNSSILISILSFILG